MLFKPVQLLRGSQVLLAGAELADGFAARFVGLMLRRRLQPDQAMCLSNCCRVHTIGMRFAIDVVFVDAGGVIVRLVGRLAPNRFAACTGAEHTIEFAAGSVRRLQLAVGQRVRWRPAPPPDSGQAQIARGKFPERPC